MGSVSYFVLGLALFFGTHLFSTFRSRGPGNIREKMGYGPYMGLYSLVSIVALVLIVMGYGSLRNMIPVWDPPIWTRHIPLTLMLPSLILLVAAYAPTGYIKKAVKHPMLAAVKIWAFSHLCANGDLASIVLFGSFLAYAVIDRIVIKRRGDPTEGKSPAIMGDAISVIGGIAAYAGIVFWAHAALFGVPVLP